MGPGQQRYIADKENLAEGGVVGVCGIRGTRSLGTAEQSQRQRGVGEESCVSRVLCVGGVAVVGRLTYVRTYVLLR